MYANQIYLAHGNYGFEAASEYYFSKPVGQADAARSRPARRADSRPGLLADPASAARAGAAQPGARTDGAATARSRAQQERDARAQPLGLHLQSPRNDLAPYFVEEIRKYLESTYGTEAVHERGLRVYTTLNVAMQRAADRAVRDGLHAYDRRHGWRGNLANILADHPRTLDTYEDDDWRCPINKGDYVDGLVTAVDGKAATVKIGPYRAVLTPARFCLDRRTMPPTRF